MADEELPEPRGLNWIAAWQALVGAVVLSLGLLALGGAIFSLAEHLPLELVEEAALVSVLFMGVGSVDLASAYGLWRRRRWAWTLTLALQGFNVLQALLALASGGFSGLVQFGLISAVVDRLIPELPDGASMAADTWLRGAPRPRWTHRPTRAAWSVTYSRTLRANAPRCPWSEGIVRGLRAALPWRRRPGRTRYRSRFPQVALSADGHRWTRVDGAMSLTFSGEAARRGP